jgi:hypothetical protein
MKFLITRSSPASRHFLPLRSKFTNFSKSKINAMNICRLALSQCHYSIIWNDIVILNCSHRTINKICTDINSVGIALGYGLDDRGSRVWFPAGAGNFSLHHRFQNGHGAHPASYPMGTKGAFSLGVKRPGSEADHSPPSSAEVKECVEIYLHSPNMSSWRSA